jgi:hypothetical protein
LISIGFWFSPTPEIQLLSTIIVLGPLTLVRPYVIVAGLVLACLQTTEPRVWVIALVAGIAMLGYEHAAGLAYRGLWRRLVSR